MVCCEAGPKDLDALGRKRAVLTCGQEPSIEALRDAARKGSEVELMPVNSPVGESKSVEMIEGGIQSEQVKPQQLRTSWRPGMVGEWQGNNTHCHG